MKRLVHRDQHQRHLGRALALDQRDVTPQQPAVVLDQVGEEDQPNAARAVPAPSSSPIQMNAGTNASV